MCERTQLAHFGPGTVALLRKLFQRAAVSDDLRCVAHRCRRLRGAVPAAQPVRCVLHRDLVLLQRRGGVSVVEQHVGQQFTHRVKAVLHRDVLLAAVLQVGRRAHQFARLGLVALRPRDPGLRAEHLHLDLLGPVALVGLQQTGAQLVELADIGLRCRRVAAARGADCPREMGDRLGRRKRQALRLQLRRASPVLALKEVARRYCGAGGVTRRHGADHLLDQRVLLYQRLGLVVLAELEVRVLHEIERVRHAGHHAVELDLRSVLVGDLVRGQVGLYRLLPQADHRIDVRRHVLRMRCRRRDLGVLVGRRDAALRDRRKVVRVDQVVRDTRVVRVLLV